MALLADSPVHWDILRDPRPTYRGDPGGRVATVHFLVALADAPAFVQHIIGTVETIPYSGGSISRVVPLVYPDDPQMFLVSYEVEYFGTPGGSGSSVFSSQFSHARVACEFATLPFGVAGDSPYWSLEADFGVAVETIPGSAFRFADNSRLSGEAGNQVGVVSYALTVFQSAQPFGYAAASLVGKVNSVAFDDFPPGTLWLKGLRSQQSRGMFSTSLVKGYNLQFRERPWREVMRPDGAWEAPLTVAGGLPKYADTDLNALKYL